MPPQGLLTIAAYLADRWEVRFIDENIRPAGARDLAWADAVLISGMHVQAEQILDIAARARAQGRVTVLGGPSVSADPELWRDRSSPHRRARRCHRPDHRPARRDPTPPAAQERFVTGERRALVDFCGRGAPRARRPGRAAPEPSARARGCAGGT